MSKVAIYPGTFDPVTNGHVDLVERALRLFDRVIIAVAVHPTKVPFLTVDERVTLLLEVFKGRSVEVQVVPGLLVDFARQHKGVIIRGIRTSSDFDYELQMAVMNRHLCADIETLFLIPSERYSLMSASFVREVSRLGGDIAPFVPEPVLKLLSSKRS